MDISLYFYSLILSNFSKFIKKFRRNVNLPVSGFFSCYAVVITINIYWPKGLTSHENIIEGAQWYFLAELVRV